MLRKCSNRKEVKEYTMTELAEQILKQGTVNASTLHSIASVQAMEAWGN